MPMGEAERLGARRQILHELTPLLEETFVAAEWGRLLVRVTRVVSGGPWVVEGLDVEELLGDEARVEQAFHGEAARASLPALAAATETLCALEGVDVALVDGGTFIRMGIDGFAFLPGLVRTPSASFDRQREALLVAHDHASQAIWREHGLEGATFRADHDDGTFVFVRGDQIVAKGTLAVIGTFNKAERQWAWGANNPTLTPEARARSAALIDSIPDRSLWEISTPAFTTDEGTARALAALVWSEAGGAATLALARGEGTIFLLLQDVRAAS